MTKAPKHSPLEQIALAVFAGAAVGSFAAARKAPLAWVFLAPCVLSLFWRIRRAPPRLVAWARYLAWTVLGGVLVLGLLSASYRVISEQAADRPSLVAGFILAGFACLFLLGTGVWAPPETFFPVTLGIFLVAAFNVFAPHLHAGLLVGGLALILYFVERSAAAQSPTETRRRTRGLSLRLGISGAAILLIAWIIIHLLPWLQVRVTQAAGRIYNPQPTIYSALSLNSRLGDIEELKLSQKVVMRVWSKHAAKLRGRAFAQFDGQNWHAAEYSEKMLSPLPEGFLQGLRVNGNAAAAQGLASWLESFPGSLFTIPGRDPRRAADADAIRTKIIQSVFNYGMLVSPGNQLLVRVDAASLRLDAFEDLAPPPNSSDEVYAVVNQAKGRVVQEDLGPPEMLAQCLAVPADTDPRLKALARHLAQEKDSARERVQLTTDYLQTNCQYNLHVGKFHSKQPVAEFLFEKKQGYCEYFASAAAVLLRLEGVPARYVTGFNVQEGNRQGDHYVVRELDTHAWVEAYLPDEGWVGIDPTPEAEYAALHAGLRTGLLANSAEWLAAEWAEFSARFGEGDWLAALRWFWGGLKALGYWIFVRGWRVSLPALVIALAVVVLRRRRSISVARSRVRTRFEELDSVPREVKELLEWLDKTWAHRGFARPPSRAPLEHLNGIPAEKISPQLRGASRQVIECFYRAAFGGAAPPPNAARELKRSLEQAEVD